MAKASFMSMRWLRLHIKEIIYATVTLFVLSIFVMGYGSITASKHRQQRERDVDEAERREDTLKNALPKNLRDIENVPVAHVSYPSDSASYTAVIDVRALYRSIKNSREFAQIAQMPDAVKSFYMNMIKERQLEQLIATTLLDLYAKANNIQPAMTPAALTEMDQTRISPAEFRRHLRREGITEEEYGQERFKQETFRLVAGHILQPIPPASATEEVIRAYYDDNKHFFQKENLLSFDHLLISPSEFLDKSQITDSQIKEYYDSNRDKFLSSKRVSASHIAIKYNDPAYLERITISDREISDNYNENLERFLIPEKVTASHILIKPENNFDLELPTFKANLKDFALVDDSQQVDQNDPETIESTSEETSQETSQETTETKNSFSLLSFRIRLSNITADTEFNLEDIHVINTNGQKFYPDSQSMELVNTPLEVPVHGSSKTTVTGTIGIRFSGKPLHLIIENEGVDKEINIASAFEEEKAYEAAKVKIEAILNKINEGGDFAELAREYSQDPGSAKAGGSLGTFGKDAMVKPFSEAAFSANIGEVTEPVRSTFGYHIIKVSQKHPESHQKLEEVKEQIISELRHEQSEAKALSELETARRKYFYESEPFENLVKLNSMSKSRANAGKLPVFFKGNLTEDYSDEQKEILAEAVCVNDFQIDPAIEEQVFDLEPGELSEVIYAQNAMHLFLVHEVLDPIQLSLSDEIKEEIKDVLDQKASREKAQQLAIEFFESLPEEERTVENIAKLYNKDEKDINISYQDMPFALNPGFGSSSLSKGKELFSFDGTTYISEIHEAIVDTLASKELVRAIGPISTSLGYHFVQLQSYDSERYDDFEEVKNDIRRMLTLDPSTEDIEEFYEENKDQFRKPATRTIRQILVNDENRALEVYKKLQGGEIFSMLATAYSLDPSATQGGLSSPVKKGALSADLDEAVWKLNVGEFTMPIKTPYGFVIAQLDTHETPEKEPSLAPDVVNTIRKKLKNEYNDLTWSYFLKGLMNRAYVIKNHDTLEKF